MIQSLDIISVNLWDTLISLANLVILFLLVKKFLFAPVKNFMDKRQEELQREYSEADKAKREAQGAKEKYEEQLRDAKERADEILSEASNNAKLREQKIISEAKEQADGIIKNAKTEAILELKKAEEGIKHEIVNVSTLIAEKMLEREINIDDHRALIDSFIERIGETDDGNE
ncbi:MAG: F0F1 ATP synthase subunit B [Ruminococcaceae bacterium]|nr:F0F1 ATP synthase subunit B [Oscillospiraceae bacterium]